MKLLRAARELERALEPLRRPGRRVGFVPTMGALHEGHLSLVRRARRDNDTVVVSIFVNPLQFGPREDYRRYPRPLALDRRLLERERVDMLYLPRAETFYPAEFQTSVSVEWLSKPLCGRSRPIHFAGVATVVLKLLNQIRPDAVYLGRKDYQQCRVIEQMAADLSLGVRVVTLPTVREPDGLAMSSRNAYLSARERQEAPRIYAALREVARLSRRQRRAAELRRALVARLSAIPGARIDYAEIVDARTLEPVVQLTSDRRTLAAAAVRLGRTRLIDNLLIG